MFDFGVAINHLRANFKVKRSNWYFDRVLIFDDKAQVIYSESSVGGRVLKIYYEPKQEDILAKDWVDVK